MLRHNLILIYRNFKRFKSTFFINLIGLSTGLAAALLIYLWVHDERSMDKFHQHDSRLFTVMTNQNRPDEIVTLAEGPALLADELPKDFPEIEIAVGATRVVDKFSLVFDERHIDVRGLFADNDFFKIFSYPVLHGNQHKVLPDKHAVAISENTARALFGNTSDAMGKSITWELPFGKTQVTVTGVFKEIPASSSSQFDMVLSNEAYKELIGPSLHWGNHNAMTYVLLREGTDVADMNKKIRNFVKTRQGDSILTLFLKRYSENYLYGLYENGVMTGGRISYVRLFSLIAIFVVVIACINFMNLTTAKASRRIKEVGIRKASGAGRATLVFQYMGESMFMAFLSLLVAILMVDLFLPRFNLITGKQLTIHFDTTIITAFAAITFFTGLIAGSYPALYLSAFSPATVLRSKYNGAVGEQWARKGLVVFQFALSIIFIVSVLVVYRQIEYVQTKNLGYDKDNIIYFKTQGAVAGKLETFLSEVKNVPGVVDASSMWGNVAGETSFTTGDFNWEGRDRSQIVQFEHLGVNYDMIELLGIRMAQGRSFSRNYPGDTARIILNEAAIQVMGLKDPVGKIFSLWGNDMEIIGVVKNFHFKTLHEKVNPFFFRLQRREFDKVMVRIESGKEREAIDGLQKLHAAFNPGFSLGYNFLDDAYSAQYAAEKRVAVLSRYFAALAVLISCLGLFGLAAFTAERRLKEIGIRKVLGSTELSIIYLLSADFTKIVFTAILIALPVSYLVVKHWLDSFAFRIPLEWWYFIGAGAAALIIAWLTVGAQAFKAARVNPAKCLKDE
jgi:ABC-type antimicrobial peptide transport system permease subunit